MTILKPIRWILIAVSLAMAARAGIWHFNEPHSAWKLFQFGFLSPLILSGLLDPIFYGKKQ